MAKIHAEKIDLSAVSAGAFSTEAITWPGGVFAIQLAGPFPGRILSRDAKGALGLVDGQLAADAPLRFLRTNGAMQAESLDGTLVFEAHERVTEAKPWSAAPAAKGCCPWWDHTLWRAAPGKLSAGLLRAVTPALRSWSVLDWHRPGHAEPVWRVNLTEGATGVVAAAVSPRADSLVLILSDAAGKASARSLSVRDGSTRWNVPLDGAAAEWRTGQGRMAYSFDGARFVVVMEDASRCETCTRLDIFDAASGMRLQRAPVAGTVATRFATVGLVGDVVWVFEHVPSKDSDMSRRPERLQYEAHNLGTQASYTIDDTPPEWGLTSRTIWALLPRYDGDGVIGLSRPASDTLELINSNNAP